MYNVMQVPGLANGQASLVEGLRATNAKGTSLPLKDLGEGDFGIAAGQCIRVAYTVRLEHDRYPWPAGMEEVRTAPTKA